MPSRYRAVFFNCLASTTLCANALAVRTVTAFDFATAAQDGRPAQPRDTPHLLDTTPALLYGEQSNKATPTLFIQGGGNAIDAAVQFCNQASGMTTAIETRADVQWFFVRRGHCLIL